MLQPKKRNFSKAQKGKVTILPAVHLSSFNNFALIALEPGRINSNQIEAARIALNRKIKKYVKLSEGTRMWINIFPDIPVTKKPAEMRMGQGKGPIHQWIVRVRTYKCLLEVSSSIPKPVAIAGLRSAAFKFPIKTKIILPTRSAAF